MRLHFLHGQNYDCVQCGRSCSHYGTVPVEERVVESLREHPLGLRVADRNGAAFDKRPDGSTVMHLVSPDDPTCVFLENQLCTIHAELGLQAKPTTCQQYPFQFTRTPEGIFAGASFFCTSVRQNSGRPLSEHAEDLVALATHGIVSQVPDEGWLEYRQLEQRFIASDFDVQFLLHQQFPDLGDKLDLLFDLAQFAALKLLLELPEPALVELDDAYAQQLPLPLPGMPWQGSWQQLQQQKTALYDRQLERWTQMYLHRKLLLLHRPWPDNLWSLALIPAVVRLYTTLNGPSEANFWLALEQAEVQLGSRGHAIDALAAQLGWFARQLGQQG